MTKAKKTALTSTELRFKVRAVRQLLKHARSCKELLPMAEGDSQPGVAGIVLVAELTVYLASNGKDAQPLSAGNRIAYAEGMDPQKWEDEFELMRKKVALVGQRDDAIFLRAEDVELVLGNSDDWGVFRINVLHDGQSIKKALMLPTPRTTADQF